MNPPTPFSSSNEPTDFPELIDEAEAPAKREGLPAGFRMRASAHYVDQLEAAPRPTLRSLAIGVIDSEVVREAPGSLVESIRALGVLEPLLVQHDPRGKQYRLLAGRMRLAAARAAGLREVPCVVHAISDAEAAVLIGATHDRRSEAAAATAAPPAPGLYPAQREIESALMTIDSCMPLLNLSSEIARRGAVQVIAAECRRAHRLIKAMKVLTDGVPLRRGAVKAAELFDRLSEAFRDEQRLLGLEPAIQVSTDPLAIFYGDQELLLTALTSGLAALTVAAGERRRDVAFAATGAPGSVSLELTDRSLILSESFVRTAFSDAWPVPGGDTALLLLQAARRIASAHGGAIAMFSDATRTTIRLQVPAEQTARTTSADRTAN